MNRPLIHVCTRTQIFDRCEKVFIPMTDKSLYAPFFYTVGAMISIFAS
jgi:hypothetical protein